MTATTVRVQLKNRTDTASAWSSANPTPLKGELCFESDTNKLKIGDGSTAYNSLSYFTGGSLSTSGGTLIGDLLIDNDKILKLFEADANGGAFVGIKGATDKGAEGSYTISLPAAAPAVNQVLKAGSSTATNMVWASETDTTYTAGSGLTLSGTTFSVNAIALTTVQEAANESAQLALTAQEGDVVVRTDENKSYVHNGGTANSMADYTLLRTPTGAVSSVNGNTGAITAAQIATAVEAASDSNTFTDADHTKLNGLTSTPEGTAILSTGESGGSKFLREDGDGSCSWQAAGGGIATEYDAIWLGGDNAYLTADRWGNNHLGGGGSRGTLTRVTNLTPVGNGVTIATGGAPGYITFSSAGMWKIDWHLQVKRDTAGDYDVQMRIFLSTDSGTNFSVQAPEAVFTMDVPSAGVLRPTFTFFLNVTNASTQRIKFAMYNSLGYNFQTSKNTLVEFSKLA